MSDITGFSLHGDTRFTIIARMRRLANTLLFNFLAVIAFSSLCQSALAQSCPDLQSYYSYQDWYQLERELGALQPLCLTSSEYFALLGAAQMNIQRLGPALESLERALLLDPDNGAAQVDYAQALFLQGQLFTALEINRRVLARYDLPLELTDSLVDRQNSWQRLTRQYQFQADFLQGYDENLNGAPLPSQITLTLPDDSVLLPLDRDSRPLNGIYSNLKLAGRYQQLAPEHQHNVLVEFSHRLSEDQDSDYSQLDARYAFLHPGRERSFQLNAAVSHLVYGGRPLYTATDFGGYYSPRLSQHCFFDAGLNAQHQLFHNQSFLNAVEARLSVRTQCADTAAAEGHQQIGMEVSLIDNRPVNSNRPGGDRDGWQINASWLRQLDSSSWRVQVNHTRLFDSSGYSPFLANGASRWLRRSYLLAQYRRPLTPKTDFLINGYYQYQSSNLELFRTRDKSFEIGFSHIF